MQYSATVKQADLHAVFENWVTPSHRKPASHRHCPASQPCDEVDSLRLGTSSSRRSNQVLEPNKKARKAVQKKHDEDLLAECGGEERILPKAEFDAVQNRLHKIQEELVLRKKSSDVDICESCKTMQKKLEELEALNRDLQKSLQQKIFSAALQQVVGSNPGCGGLHFDESGKVVGPCAQIWVHVKEPQVVPEPNKKARMAVQKKYEEDLLTECGGEERTVAKAECDAVQNRLHKIEEEFALLKKSSDADIRENCKIMKKKLEELEALNRETPEKPDSKDFFPPSKEQLILRTMDTANSVSR
ncbi:hypothetical protein HPB51_005588 [Rhipicephalus microplus]|uniref:Uncharacterized protein n=1 Tax=Rhipicephalus microplus TaxID=6941 RepID=A0A9J6EFW1_RHIMP|nr:hypothetical protein HPB51_005588 [Rhipicephalus microplus]